MSLVPFNGVTLILAVPAVDRRGARLAAGLPAVGASQRARLVRHAPRGCLAVRRRAGAGALHPGRRPQHRVHRAELVRRLHHQRVQRELHRPRARDRPAQAVAPALLSRHVPGAAVRHEPRAGREQYRPDVGRDRARDAHHRADGRHLPHPRGARGGVEIFHPRQRRHRAGAVRHHPRLHGGAPGGRRGARRDGVDGPHRARRRLRSRVPQRRLRVPAARLRHQGRPRAAACLAARRPCRRPDADLGGALRPAAQRRALRRAALQDAARRQSRRARPGPADGDDGAHLAHLRRLHAVPAPRHQAHVRLFVDRAHGDHRVRLRHGRPARQFRRAAPHDHAQPDQVGDLLHRRPYRPGQGNPADRRHPGPDGDAIRCSAGAWCSAWSPSPACRRSASSPASSWW